MNFKIVELNKMECDLIIRALLMAKLHWIISGVTPKIAYSGSNWKSFLDEVILKIEEVRDNA